MLLFQKPALAAVWRMRGRKEGSGRDQVEASEFVEGKTLGLGVSITSPKGPALPQLQHKAVLLLKGLSSFHTASTISQ